MRYDTNPKRGPRTLVQGVFLSTQAPRHARHIPPVKGDVPGGDARRLGQSRAPARVRSVERGDSDA